MPASFVQGFQNGGQNVYTSISGILTDTAITSGQGRLNKGFTFNPLTSGGRLIFYDSAVATSGGPFVGSGHKVLGVLGTAGVSGTAVLANQAVPLVLDFEFPFYQGLCVANSTSGTPSFSVTWTRESIPANP